MRELEASSRGCQAAFGNLIEHAGGRKSLTKIKFFFATREVSELVLQLSERELSSEISVCVYVLV